jgi:hypothetical protein
MLTGRKFFVLLAEYLVSPKHMEIKHAFAKGRILTPTKT